MPHSTRQACMASDRCLAEPTERRDLFLLAVKGLGRKEGNFKWFQTGVKRGSKSHTHTHMHNDSIRVSGTSRAHVSLISR